MEDKNIKVNQGKVIGTNGKIDQMMGGGWEVRKSKDDNTCTHETPFGV